MKVTHYGHACLLVEENDTRILIDPGSFSSGHTEVENIDAILITHEHRDHLDVPSLKAIMEKSPGLQIITSQSVHDILEKEGIRSTVVGHGAKADVKGVEIEGIGEKHALIHKAVPIVDNVGYMVGGRLFHPGDKFTDPGREVEILAVPLGGPWMKLGEAVDYAIEVAPKKAFPIHDAMFTNPGHWRNMVKGMIEDAGVSFVILEHGKEVTLQS